MTAADRRKLNKDAGFSLLELLIAVVILAIIVIPLLNLFVSSNRINVKSRQTLRATTLAQDIMEGLKAYNIEEIKTQFANPAEGFYVIDDNLIKGAVAEEAGMETEPGIYYFSLKEVTMQGSKFDALVKVDARNYMEGATGPDAHDNLFNNATMADARSIDKKNGTFVETDKIRQAMLASVWKDTAMRTAMEADGVTKDDFDKIYFKNQDTFFTGVSRTITVNLKQNGTDENGKPKIDMSVTDEYEFVYQGTPCLTTGDMDSLISVRDMGCGVVSGDEININIFYFPLYGTNVTADEIIVNNDSTAKLNLLIAKQVPSTDMNVSNPEALTDAQLLTAEKRYEADVKIQNGHSSPMDKEKFTLKTNLGLNLAGKKYMSGESDPDNRDVDTPNQLCVNGKIMDLSGTSGMNIYTLDGVPSRMGTAADGKVSELIYDVEISVYKEGAAGKGFPAEDRMIVIEGSKNN